MFSRACNVAVLSGPRYQFFHDGTAGEPKRAIRNRSRAPVLGFVLVLFSVPDLWLKIGPDFGTSQYIYVLAAPVLVLDSGPDFGLAKIYKTGPAHDKLKRGR